jgi:hypothetical protein
MNPGSIYWGEFKNGPEGYGIEEFLDGREPFYGQWKDGVRNGYGIETFNRYGKYRGEFKYDEYCYGSRYSGYGHIKYPN